jgi:hypothetical protein
MGTEARGAGGPCGDRPGERRAGTPSGSVTAMLHVSEVSGLSLNRTLMKSVIIDPSMTEPGRGR